MSMSQYIQQKCTASDLHLLFDYGDDFQSRRELLLRDEDWPGQDIQVLADAITSAWSLGFPAAEDGYRLAPGESRRGRRGCVGRIMDGLRADLFFERKLRSHGQVNQYSYPIFFVDRAPGGSHRQFRIGTRCSYPLAYARAVAHYASLRELSQQGLVHALCQAPSRDIFLDVIAHRRGQGYDVNQDKMLSKIGLTTNHAGKFVEHAA